MYEAEVFYFIIFILLESILRIKNELLYITYCNLDSYMIAINLCLWKDV